MPALRSPTRWLRARTGDTDVAVAMREPAAPLASWVRQLCGYRERASGPLRRTEYPGLRVVVIVEWEPTLRVYEPGDRTRFTRHAGGFAAGIHDRFTLTEHEGFQQGVQIDLTPAGARGLFALPLSEISSRAVALADLLPRAHRRLAERLGDTDDWDARLDLVEAFLQDRLLRGDTGSPVVSHAVARIEAAGGAVDVRALSRELGYSPKHVITLFREHVGVPPKLLARIVRFDRLIAHLRAGGRGSWGELAQRYGYYDQSHLVRDVRQFTGATPTAARAALLQLAEAPAPAE